MVSSPRRSRMRTSSINAASDSALVAALAAAAKTALGAGVIRETATVLDPPDGPCASPGRILDAAQAGGGATCGTLGTATGSGALGAGSEGAVGATLGGGF